MNILILSTFTIGTLSTITGSNSQNIPTVNLQRCSDFPERLDPTEFNLKNYPREDPLDDKPIHYTLSGRTIDFEKNESCQGIETGRILAHSGNRPDVKVGTENSHFESNNHRYGAYIARDGRYFDGLIYHKLTDYCVKEFGYDLSTKTNLYTDIRICKDIKTLDEFDRIAFCPIKCCAPNFIIDYATSNCRPLKPNEPGWTPKVCDKDDCLYENDFCRHGYGLNWAGSGDLCGDNAVVIRYSSKVRLEKYNSHLHLLYKANNGEWSRFERPYCMDGFVDRRDLTYKNTRLDQVVVVCKKDAEGIEAFNAGYKFRSLSFHMLILILVACLMVKDA